MALNLSSSNIYEELIKSVTKINECVETLNIEVKNINDKVSKLRGNANTISATTTLNTLPTQPQNIDYQKEVFDMLKSEYFKVGIDGNSWLGKGFYQSSALYITISRENTRWKIIREIGHPIDKYYTIYYDLDDYVQLYLFIKASLQKIH